MTHGTIHVKDNEMVIVLHTTHDGHTYEAFVDCACMPVHLWRMLGGEKWYGVESIKKEKTLEKVNEFMHSLIPLQTDVLSFSSWVVGMKCGHWFPMPHICANEATLKYFGRDRADVEVALSDERLPLVTVKLVDGDCPVDEWGRIKETIEKRVGKERIKEYKFNDKDMTAEYKLDLVFAHMVHATK